ncbi:hypothetical protein [Anaeromicropila populeti]|uniref:Uncharacterized protein n=1 Tax=Anaeromicropila populeti TaxID=37658 RepID=A0A1I6JGR6_9FIRM|nr:hypothetical protein [Anaeromicropila populeti]SFR77800.1 hypothetical protein SAMN05661086_01646 [Anaeromicropila populeti]
MYQKIKSFFKKKQKYIIGIAVILLLVIVYKANRDLSQKEVSVEEHVVEKSIVSKEPKLHLADYDELANQDTETEQPEASGSDMERKTDENPDVGSDSKKIKVMDESEETMKDETIENEYDGEPNADSIEFFEVEVETGKDVNGDVAPSGEKVGTWE